MKYQGEIFLRKIYKDLEREEYIKHTSSFDDSKNEQVHKYLARLEKSIALIKKNSFNGKELLKKLFYQRYVIKKENITESYFEYLKEQSLLLGYGAKSYTEEEKTEAIKIIQESQKCSLDVWLDYFFRKDNPYPVWFLYYSFMGMIRLGKFDLEKNAFMKRTKTTIADFVELNPQALSLIYEYLMKYFNKEVIEDSELNRLIQTGSFASLYSYFLKQFKKENKKHNVEDGVWKTFKKNSNAQELVDAIMGKGTGWCIVSFVVAQSYLNSGDFYIYFTRETSGDYTQPRIAIYVKENAIDEVRGIDVFQSIEPSLEEIANNKILQFSNRELFLKKEADMHQLAKLYKEFSQRELTIDELIFLYEINEPIIGYIEEKDPRINEILKKRNKKKDLQRIFQCHEEQITDVYEDVLEKKDIICYTESVDVIELPQHGKMPQYILGPVEFDDIEEVDTLVFGKLVTGTLVLDSVEKANKFVLPERVYGEVLFVNLVTANEVVFPKYVGGTLLLCSLTDVSKLIFPEVVMGDLSLDSLVNPYGLDLPKYIGGTLDLSSLKRAKGLSFPETVNENVILDSLQTVNGLVLPKYIGGTLDLNDLTNGEGLILTDVQNELNLNNLKTGKGLVFPKTMNCFISLENLETAIDLKLPEWVFNGIDLSSLKNAKGLCLPKGITCLYLASLESTENLVLPSVLSEGLMLDAIKVIDGFEMPNLVGGELSLYNLEVCKNCKMPEIVDGNLALPNLLYADNLVFPREIKGTLFLNHLERFDGIVFPDGFSCTTLISDIFDLEDLMNASKRQVSQKKNEYDESVMKK